MTQSKVEAVKLLYSLELNDNDFAFIFLGYSGILLRSKNLAIAIDPSRFLSQPEVSAIEYLDLLFFTHAHWDHYKNKEALEIIKQTGAHVVADVLSSEELKESVPSNNITIVDTGSYEKPFKIEDHEVVALQGIHVGPIIQYLVNFGGIKVFHGGDSGYWRQKNISADIAFVPTGTAKTCSPAAALAMVMNLQPKITIPVHGNKQDIKQFEALMEKILPMTEVIIPKKFKVIKFTY
ncbi:MAG: MBL fold metallo-hydrolase [Candidatus Hodarchaeales archaeon]|jgi:L-ascorbate metabolism protein UlaG (beta-lactamase superfamily)